MNLETKSCPILYSKILLFLAALQIFTLAGFSQSFAVEIKVDAETSTALVSGRLDDGVQLRNPRNISFLREATGFPLLGARIRDLELFDAQGKAIVARKLMDGEYVTSAEYRSWKYAVDLTPPSNRAGFAHASWIDKAGGMLLPGDLLPGFAGRASLMRISPPEGWNSYKSGLGSEDLSLAVIFIGKGYRKIEVKAGSGDVSLLVNGGWHFTDDEANEMAREIFDEYSKLLGNLPKLPYLISLQRFPGEHPHGQWEAETRGRTVTIFSSDMPFHTQSLQRLHEQLRHEIFHLWFPNGINLIGDYAWFYEGFAMYSSLKLGVKLNRIRFEDFLDTLSRAHTIDANAKPRKALTDSSIDPTVRYARGMLIAFLTDLETLRNSGGKKDVSNNLRTLFVDRPRLPHGEVASEALTSVVTNPTLIQRYVNGAEIVDWTAELEAAGIQSKQTGRASTLAVAAKLNGRQKEILDRLGYNNWRKIGTKK